MFPQDIVIRGTKVHNLKCVDIVLPHVSGSGKSSLAGLAVHAEDAVPPGMTAAYFEPHTYAVFVHRGQAERLPETVGPCASGKGVETCAHCDDFEICETLQGFIANITTAKNNLLAIRAALCIN